MRFVKVSRTHNARKPLTNGPMSDRLHVARPSGGVRQCPGDRGKMASSCQQDEDMLLIEQVRQNPTLYNTELADYKDGALKEHLWEQVATAVNKSSAECRRRWKYLRDSFNRCKRKNKRRTGFAALKATKWCYFGALQFLDKDPPDTQENNMSINIKTSDSYEDDDPDDNDANNANFEFCMVNDEDTAIDKCEVTHSTDTDVEPPKVGRKRKMESEDAHEYNQPLINYLPDKRNPKNKANASSGGEIDSFCSYIGDILKKLNPALRVDAKTKIFNLMAQYEIQNLNYE